MLPSKDSTAVRTLRVATYELLGLFLAIMANPDAVELLRNYYPEVFAILVGFAPVATFIVNLLRRDVKNW
jgi:hypothetical protein